MTQVLLMAILLTSKQVTNSIYQITKAMLIIRNQTTIMKVRVLLTKGKFNNKMQTKL